MQQHEEAEGSLNSGERHAQALVEVEVEEPECTESQIPEVLE